MGNKNYSKYAKHSKNKIVVDDIVGTFKLTQEPVIEEEQKAEDIVPIENIPATITGCQNLYVRELPDKKSKSLGIVDKYTDIIVNVHESTKDFYKVEVVIADVSVSGYCMKQFIKFK